MSEEKLFGQGDPAIAEYAVKVFKPEDELLATVRKTCAENHLPMIQVGQMDGLLLETLTRLTGAKKIVEVGTLGGYSGICLLRGGGAGSHLYTFEYNPLHAKVAKDNFRLAGLSQQVSLFEGSALENLAKIEKHGPFDVVFIDADKNNYVNYFKLA